MNEPAVRTVVDTNVLVSGLLSATGPPARIVDSILQGLIAPVLSREVLDEYRRVLARRELGLPSHRVDAVLEFLDQFTLPLPIRAQRVCSDPDDDKYLAAALEGRADWVITGNTRHYPASPFHGVSILTPAQAAKRLEALLNR